MENFGDLTVDQILLFLLALIRVATLYALFPIFGSRNTPTIMKVGLSLITTMILFPLLPRTVIEIPTGVFSFAVVISKEVLAGLILGYGSTMLFSIITFAGKLIDQQSGFAMSEVLDPLSEESVSLLGQFKIVLFTIVFLLIGGHRILIQGIAYSFDTIPLCGVKFTGPVTQKILSMTTQVFVLGIKLSAPVVVTHLLVTAALGLVARTAPQMNVFVIGMPLNVGVGLIMLAITLPAMLMLFDHMVIDMKTDLFTLVKLLS